MSYENYSFVSWTTGTPMTSDRLQQMSVNIEQVRDANDDKPKGLLKIKQSTTNVVISNTNAFTPLELISLADEGGGTDNRVTADNNRWLRVTLTFPGFLVNAAGGEDATYYLELNQGQYGGVVSKKANFQFNSGALVFVNTATSSASVSNLTIDPNKLFGAGTYSVVIQSTGFVNETFHVKAGKVQGVSNNNASGYSIIASNSVMQFYVEDIGGLA